MNAYNVIKQHMMPLFWEIDMDIEYNILLTIKDGRQVLLQGDGIMGKKGKTWRCGLMDRKSL